MIKSGLLLKWHLIRSHFLHLDRDIGLILEVLKLSISPEWDVVGFHNAEAVPDVKA